MSDPPGCHQWLSNCVCEQWEKTDDIYLDFIEPFHDTPLYRETSLQSAPKHVADLLAEAYISSVYAKFSQHEQLILNTVKEIPPKFYRRVYD